MINVEQFVFFNKQLGELIESGITLETGLQEIAEHARGDLKDLFKKMSSHLEQGMEFDAVLDRYQEKLPPLYIAMCKAGVKAGNLSSALEYYATFSFEETSFRKKMRVITAYPVITLIATIFFVLISSVIRLELELELSGSLYPGWRKLVMAAAGDPVFILISIAILIGSLGLWYIWSDRVSFISRLLWFFPPTRSIQLASIGRMIHFLVESGNPINTVPGFMACFSRYPAAAAFWHQLDASLERGLSLQEAIELQDQGMPHLSDFMRKVTRGPRIEKKLRDISIKYKEDTEDGFQVWMEGYLPVMALLVGGVVFLNIVIAVYRFIPHIVKAVSG